MFAVRAARAFPLHSVHIVRRACGIFAGRLGGRHRHVNKNMCITGITRQLQLTLAILKPDVCKIPMKLEAVRQIILDNDFVFVKSKVGSYTRDQMEKFYAEHEDLIKALSDILAGIRTVEVPHHTGMTFGKFFFERLASYMSSGPLSVHILAKENGIREWRTLLGPTKVFKAVYEAPHSIRARFGLTDTRNAGHGSDSEESARREIAFFFPEFDQDFWYLNEEQRWRRAKLMFDLDRCEHVVIDEQEEQRST